VVARRGTPLTPLNAARYLPSRVGWDACIERALALCASGSLKKVVLARQTSWNISLSPWQLLAQLAPSPQVTQFALALDPEHAFVGATPELLFVRAGERMWVDALAGTGDQLHAPKEQREFQLVKEALEAQLRPLAKVAAWQGEQALALGALRHLYDQFEVLLNAPQPSDADLIALLHPTPALGGHPRGNALSLISALEPFDRGWYGAPFGYSEPEAACFAVAIRSALLTKDALHAFTGAGIVPGSDPGREWDELESKLSWLTRAGAGS
jgi:menaquinone-specific isochorismate synthase